MVRQTISLQTFRGCLPQFLLGPFLNILIQMLGRGAWSCFDELKLGAIDKTLQISE